MCASKNPTRSKKGLGLYSGARIKDHLDQMSLAYIEGKSFEGEMPNVVELGCGAGTHTIRMAQMGAHVTAIDLDASNACDLLKRVALHNLLDPEQVIFIEKDWRHLEAGDLPQEIDVLFSQRSLSYVAFADLCKIISYCSSKMKTGSSLFISLNGIDSLYGADHPLRDAPLEKRFGPLSDKMQTVLNASEPVCVYRQEEIARVFEGTNIYVEEIQKTPFGNFQIKGIFKG